MPSHKRDIGDIGENAAVSYLKQQGHKILHRNYSKKWGEIDIITAKSGILHFIEVKSVSFETIGFSPEAHVNYAKRQRLRRTIYSYLLEQHVSNETLYQVDVAVVRVNMSEKTGNVELLEHVEIES